MIQKISIGLFGSGILLLSIGLLTGGGIGSSYAQFDFNNNDNSESESPFDFIIERNDKLTYLCMNMDSMGGLDEDNTEVREDTKKECNELLENTDFFKKKELIKKYGELDG